MEMEIYNHIPRSELEIVIARNNEDITLFIPFSNNLVIYNNGNINTIDSFNNNIINCPNIGTYNGLYLKYIIDNYYNLPNYILFTRANPINYIYNNNVLLSFQLIHDIFNEDKDYKFKYLSKYMVFIKENELYDYTSGLPSLRIDYGTPIETKYLINKINSWHEHNFIDDDKSIKNLLTKLNILVNNNSVLIHYYEFTELYDKDIWFMTSIYGKKFREEMSIHFNFDNILPLIKNKYSFGYGEIFIVNKSQILKYPKHFWENIYIPFLEEMPSSTYGLEKIWRYLFDEVEKADEVNEVNK